MAWRSPAWAPTQREVKWNHLSRACFCVFINSFPNQNHTLQNPFPGRHQAIDHERQASPSIFTHPSEELQQLYSESANSVPAPRRDGFAQVSWKCAFKPVAALIEPTKCEGTGVLPPYRKKSEAGMSKGRLRRAIGGFVILISVFLRVLSFRIRNWELRRDSKTYPMHGDHEPTPDPSLEGN